MTMRSFFLLGFALLDASLAGASPPPVITDAKHFVLPFQVTNSTSATEILSVNG